MATFVTVIKTIHVRHVADVPRGRVRRVPREVIHLTHIVNTPSDVDSEVEEPETVATPATDGNISIGLTL
ncbi:hypothetical protein L915_11621 [Phytophthora nicotianae]|uniref:Uncharacterized protein n=1 Tax=Phytophthora nicotianae TaxID=4792 RepID=W2GLD2_PHYNI|nr:hypothetical protein L915_11621 [Phytophthora nicotianae]